MKKKILPLIFVLALLLSGSVLTSVIAQPRIPGVVAGNWLKYGDVSVYWNCSDPSQPIPHWLEELEEMEYGIISIVHVYLTNVTCELRNHFKNGTDLTTGGYVDIDTGEGENLTMYVISANLDKDHAIYTSGDNADLKINETITRTYPDGPRDTNHINITAETSSPDFYQYISINYYWDRSTGVLAELTQESTTRYQGVNSTFSMLIRISESNVWVIPEYPTLTPILLILILTVAITIYKRRRLSHLLHSC